jgi:mono/diheme cytochrome c family protein
VRGAAGPDVDAEDLRPGLLTTHRDSTPLEITRLEPTIALLLKAGEAAHPRLSPQGSTIRWEGYLNILRPGTYRFSARLRGKFRLTVAGKEVFAAEATDDAPALQHGPTTRLEAGAQPLQAEFTRLPGPARLELLWRAPHFREEPLPYDHLGHLPAKVPARLAADILVERGRFLAEEHSCTRCHQPAANDRLAHGLVSRQGPDLSEVGQRAFVGWIERWLESPQTLRPGATMPRLFSEDEKGRAERHAVAVYLASLGGPLRPQSEFRGREGGDRWRDLQASLARGRRLFTATGCVACHGADTTGLPNLGSKTTPEKLAAYLTNPLAVDPSGRMPQMQLSGTEARDLARYLCRNRDATLATDPPNPDAQLLDLGKRVLLAKGCTNCHPIAPGGKPLAGALARVSFEDLKQSQRQRRGCLADPPMGTERRSAESTAPRFNFDAAARQALRAFLREGTTGAGSPAPAYAAQVTLQRYNCLACHSRDGTGGLTPDLVEELRRFENAENAEAVSPPPLTGVGHKLRTPWLRQVLTQAGRARPWMGLRMPQFGAANVGQLAEALAAVEGTDPDDTIHQTAVTTATVEAGRQLVGKSAFGCISCHDLAGFPNSGTRGPDLAGQNQRVRHEWYRRWLEQPQRMQPGTRMPMVFPDGKSVLPTILGGNADAQAEAIWAYLSLGASLPLPDGLEPPKGLVLTAKDRPVLLRTFLPDAGSRAIAVGFPNGVSVAFDAATCRLAYAWSGNFLDAGPVWNNRGGNPAKLLGPRFWTAPPGCPWAATTTDEPPDFAALARDPARGAALPEGQLYDGPRQLRFVGYATDKAGVPTFRYQVNIGESQPVTVSERPEPLRHAAGIGVCRQFTLDVPPHRTAWLWAAEATQAPRVLDRAGNRVATDATSGAAETAAAERALVLPQGGGRVVLLTVASAPAGTRWHLARHGGGWHALLVLPASSEAARLSVRLNVWTPYRDDAGFLKELSGIK